MRIFRRYFVQFSTLSIDRTNILAKRINQQAQARTPTDKQATNILARTSVITPAIAPIITATVSVVAQQEQPQEGNAREMQASKLLTYHKPGILGCKHYARRAAIQAPCCGEIFTCRLCHDEQILARAPLTTTATTTTTTATSTETPATSTMTVNVMHQIDRFKIKNMVCLTCAANGNPGNMIPKDAENEESVDITEDEEDEEGEEINNEDDFEADDDDFGEEEALDNANKGNHETAVTTNNPRQLPENSSNNVSSSPESISISTTDDQIIPLQPISSHCIHCNAEIATYFCNICNLFDNNPNHDIFHCEECGFCRRGKISEYFHCRNCDCCYALSVRDSHTCLQNILKSSCPICLDDLHTSTKMIYFPPCGHPLHMQCAEYLIKHSHEFALVGASCCTCRKTLLPDRTVRAQVEQFINDSPMAPEYLGIKVDVICNDCNRRCETNYHVIASQCIYEDCKSFNTEVETPLATILSKRNEQRQT